MAVFLLMVAVSVIATGASFTAVIVMLIKAMLLSTSPSCTLKLKLSMPFIFSAGTY